MFAGLSSVCRTSVELISTLNCRHRLLSLSIMWEILIEFLKYFNFWDLANSILLLRARQGQFSLKSHLQLRWVNSNWGRTIFFREWEGVGYLSTLYIFTLQTYEDYLEDVLSMDLPDGTGEKSLSTNMFDFLVKEEPLGEEDLRALQKDRQKKDNHNMSKSVFIQGSLCLSLISTIYYISIGQISEWYLLSNVVMEFRNFFSVSHIACRCFNFYIPKKWPEFEWLSFSICDYLF